MSQVRAKCEHSVSGGKSPKSKKRASFVLDIINCSFREVVLFLEGPLSEVPTVVYNEGTIGFSFSSLTPLHVAVLFTFTPLLSLNTSMYTVTADAHFNFWIHFSLSVSSKYLGGIILIECLL